MSAHPFNLDGRTALVTGSSRGLGFEIAQALAAAGATVLVNGRNTDGLRRAIDVITGAGGVALPLAFDTSDQDAVEDAFRTIAGEHDGLDILVNNVGIRDRRPVFEFSLDDVRRMLDTNLLAPMDLARRAALQMKAKQRGRIINITSIAGPLASGSDTVYTMAKGGLDALTRSLAAEFGADVITVNAIAPGFFATETNQAMAADPGIAKWLAQRTSLGRWGQPTEISGAAVFLASDAASYITGHTLVVDGGYLAHF